MGQWRCDEQRCERHGERGVQRRGERVDEYRVERRQERDHELCMCVSMGGDERRVQRRDEYINE